MKRNVACMAGGFLTALTLLAATQLRAGSYDPLAIGGGNPVATLDLTVRDSARDRDIPLLIYLPATTNPAPVVLFSHGLGGSRNGSAFLGQHWAARGYLAVFVQHPGSDSAIWMDTSPGNRMSALNEAASLKNLVLRLQDIPAVLDQLEKWNATAGNQLKGRMDLQNIGMSGHSFGAVTTQGVSGQTLPGSGRKFVDSRIKAAVIFSPSAPRVGSADRAFGDVRIPWMLMTGTKDLAPIGHADMASRLAVYPALHGVPKYELVLNHAEHSVFTDRPLPGDHEQRNPNHHRVILALSTAFWDAWLRGDKAALEWLQGPGPRSVMEKADRWQQAAK